MTKFMPFALLCILFSFFNMNEVFAITIDTSNATNGLVAVSYDGDFSSPVKVVVKKESEQYVYTIRTNQGSNVPLNMGAGNYSVSVLQGVGGTKFRPLQSETISVSVIDETEMYKASHLIVNYDESTRGIPFYKNLAGSKQGTDKINTIYKEQITNYSYDFDKARNVVKDYVPVIDKTFAEKKGICYDYAVLFVGSLRSQGVPARLLMGYAPEIEEYHAWSQVLMNGKWVTIDTTYDAQMVRADVKYSFEKDGSKYKVLKTY